MSKVADSNCKDTILMLFFKIFKNTGKWNTCVCYKKHANLKCIHVILNSELLRKYKHLSEIEIEKEWWGLSIIKFI